MYFLCGFCGELNPSLSPVELSVDPKERWKAHGKCGREVYPHVSLVPPLLSNMGPDRTERFLCPPCLGHGQSPTALPSQHAWIWLFSLLGMPGRLNFQATTAGEGNAGSWTQETIKSWSWPGPREVLGRSRPRGSSVFVVPLQASGLLGELGLCLEWPDIPICPGTVLV